MVVTASPHVDAQPRTSPPRGFIVMNLARTATAYSLLVAQLLFFLFVLEVPYWLWDRFISEHRGDAFYSGQRGIARWFFRLYPFGRRRLVHVNRRAFPTPCVIVCNHQSTLDILMALTLPVNARWIVKRWVAKIPLMGETNQLARHIIVDDDETDPERPRGFDTALDWLKQGVSILVFPEGSRSPDGRLHRFRNGAFALARDAGVPIVPVVLHGTGACVRKRSAFVHPPDVVLRVLPPVSTEGFDGEAGVMRLKFDVHERMSAALEELQSGRSLPGVAWPIGVLSRLGMFVAALIIATIAGLSLYVRNFCIAEPPHYNGDRALAAAEIRERDGVKRLRVNWRRQRGGINEIGLSGDEWQRGYANARLCQDLVEKQEQHLLRAARQFLPNAAATWLLKQLVAVNNRRLPEFVTGAEQLEVLGLTEGSINHFPDDEPFYHRILNYHAVHDISHMLIDNPLVSRGEIVGCTAFAAWGPASHDGELFVGRNFDFEGGEVFDDDKAVLYVWPQRGIPYAHVSWAGMAGAVTGMNAEGLYVHLNAARSSDTGLGRIGTPVCMMLRRVLEGARTIDEAFTIIRDAQVFVSDTYLVASRRDGRAVVIEKSPSHCALREPARKGLVLQTNHFLTEPLSQDPVNREQVERATTQFRWDRLQELTGKHFGAVNAKIAQDILRDKSSKGGKDVGLGNRNTIDAGICAHSVVANVSNGELWVAASPHTFGRYVYVPVTRMLAAGPEGALRIEHLPEMDLARYSMPGVHRDLREFRRSAKAARKAIDDGELESADAHVRTCVNVNPASFETAWLQGLLNYERKKYAEAAKDFQRALDLDPHYEEVREHIRAMLRKAEGKSK